MGLHSTRDWNRFLLRFFIAFGFWEVISVPLRSLLFSAFYYDSSLRTFFTPVSEIQWIAPILSDLVQVFFLGIVVTLARSSFQFGIIGGIVTGISFSIAGFIAPVFGALQFTKSLPNKILWAWVFYQSALTLVGSLIYAIRSEDE
ncbi:hypothetical protein CH373_01560 [Leptospira perolatii]|uniref:Uncharacterized protein n=1 Tax=Leptospira perolatii TaxID=2023191 RepID=A0A2M9ZS08_9LEPT|nr:hypothetical protein [Leptospira perolatii]PJZ71226.1 hypothetical protein CH360_01560 [Leptospira perolatii]PJZ74759.1 hypothetical protein CH373_01560 [Leptospira perolatii]